MPEAAYYEDCDSDESSAIPGTRVHANSSAGTSTTGRGKEPAARPSQGRDAASDSGYSSHASPQSPRKVVATSASAATSSSAMTLRPSLKPSSSQAPPAALQRSNSSRSAQRSNTVSASMSKPRGCTDPHCQDPKCLSERNLDRRYTMPNQKPSQPGYPPTGGQPHYSQAPHHQFTTMGPPPPPTVHPASRPRSGSTSRARPVSIHGYSMPSIHTSFDTSARGPPPSSSAYYGYSPGTYAPAMGSAPSNSTSAYPLPSPGLLSPTTPLYSASSSSSQYSARTANPNVPGLDHPRQTTVSQSGGGLPSARATQRPGYSESDSESSFSESDASEDDRRYRHRRSITGGNTQVLVARSSSRRPVVSKSYTTSSVPRRSRSPGPHSVDYMLRAPHSDTGLDYPSSDQFDSDRTARAIIGRRGTVSSSTRSSRRPSVSTTASSSGRTKATTISSLSDVSKVVIEGRNGRRVDYLSKHELARRFAQQKLEDRLVAQQRQLQDNVAAYQNAVGGGEPFELTAENIRRQQKRSSGSHVSGSARSQRSAGSKTSKPDGIKIHSGDTVLHIYGEAKVEMRPGEDGGPAQVFIASTSGRDSGYHTSSKSGSSRKGRSQTSRKDYADDYPHPPPRHER